MLRLLKWLQPGQRRNFPKPGRRNTRRVPRGRRLVAEPLESRELLSTLPAGFQESTVALDVNPTGFTFAPDGRMFVANKQGVVSIIEADGSPAAAPFFTVPVDNFR